MHGNVSQTLLKYERMFEQATAIVTRLRDLVGSLEPRCLRGDDAARMLSLFAEAERLAGVGKTLMARRVEETSQHRREGHRSAADYVAAKTKTSPGAAGRALETARRLEKLAETSQAWRRGDLSEAQAAEIASAASADPTAESDLVKVAATGSLPELTERCRRVRAAAAADEKARHAALHRSRYLRHWSGPDGAFRMDLRTTPEAGAAILAGLEPFRAAILADARAAGSRERAEAYAADALETMARSAGAGARATAGGQAGQGPAAGVAGETDDGGAAGSRAGQAPSSGGPKATVAIRVDASALARGHTEAGETCEIPGIGPVPVATARALLGDAVVKLLLTRGVDVVAVVHLGRTVTAHQRSALEQRDPTCVVAGCPVRRHLEIDHVDGWALTRVTTLDRLARLCSWHHHQKTYGGYRLEGGPGAWRWCAPAGEAGPGPPEGAAPAETLFAG